jgi:biopolymer transport protein ExbB
MNMLLGATKFIAAGGIWVIPILIVGALGIGVILERYIVLTRATAINRKMWDKLQPVLHQGDFEQARELTRNDKSTVSTLLNVGFESQGVVRRREDIELAMDEVMMSITPQFEKRIPFLALFANLATLLGLFGTIIGLIEAFAAVATAAPSEKSALLSLSISEAMSCTATGLMVAMPMLTFSLLLNMKASSIVDGLEIAALKTVNMIARFNTGTRNQQAEHHGETKKTS